MYIEYAQEQVGMLGVLRNVSCCRVLFALTSVSPRLSAACPQVGTVVAATGAGESSKARRKRKRAEEADGGAGGAAGGRASWASAKLQKRAFSQAWLAFLKMDLPQVGTSCRGCCGRHAAMPGLRCGYAVAVIASTRLFLVAAFSAARFAPITPAISVFLAV